jgi:hypothetical protein
MQPIAAAQSAALAHTAREGTGEEAVFEGPERVAHEAEREEEAEEPPLSLALDLVVGFGKFHASSESSELSNIAQSVTGGRTEGTTKTMTESFVLAAGYEVAEHFGVGVRVPLTFGTLELLDGDSYSTFALGNVEIEGEYGIRLAPHAELSFSLGIAVPTAQGEEAEAVPADAEPKIDRGFLQRAAAATRGFEDEALFEIKRLGIIPKAMLDYRYGALLLRPFVKVETLISTESDPEHRVLFEVLVGSYFGAALGEHIELGARIWTDLVLAGGGDSVGVVEPQVAALFGHVRIVLAGILPIAGALTDPYFGGVRLGIGARL